MLWDACSRIAHLDVLKYYLKGTVSLFMSSENDISSLDKKCDKIGEETLTINMTTPEQKWVELTQRSGPLTEQDLGPVYDALKPVAAKDVIGEWKGGSFETNHPVHAKLQELNWLGKTFHTTEDVDPIMVEKDGQRVWDPSWGHARLRQIEFRGVLSTAMIYDNHPIIDHFRRVNDKMLAGAMDTNMFGDNGTYYFYLYM